MKTTLDLDDDLHARAKSFAARQRIPLTRLIEQALTDRLDGINPADSATPIEVPTFRLGLKRKFKSANLNHLAAELGDEATLSRRRS